MKVSRAVGANIRRLRVAQGLSVTALASMLRGRGRPTHPAVLTRIETGQHESGSLRAVTVDELVAIAEALGVAPVALLNGPNCETCMDMPPSGFSCKKCGAEA
ncbi:helix-turn-helix domain-containing protein [Streptomyces antibioticus]|uniref:helix-turn-helix domain-containing protein n=1 Tax=Streptomyces antibioticus TaxID=1890 RepID=UPI00368325DC